MGASQRLSVLDLDDLHFRRLVELPLLRKLNDIVQRFIWMRRSRHVPFAPAIRPDYERVHHLLPDLAIRADCTEQADPPVDE